MKNFFFTYPGKTIVFSLIFMGVSLMTLAHKQSFGISPIYAAASSCSQTNCTLDAGNFRLLNNKWGNPDATQSIFINDDNSVGWSWNHPADHLWNYPEITVGTQFWRWDPSTWSLFPLQYQNLNTATATIKYKFTQAPTVGSWWDLGFDIYWMNGKAGATDKKYNIMIWIHGRQGFIKWPYLGDVSDGYNTYSYYATGPTPGVYWPRAIFVLKNRDQIPYEPVQNQEYAITINIKALMNSITAPLDGSWYIPDIQLGDENSGCIRATTGTIEIDSYNLEVNGNTIAL